MAFIDYYKVLGLDRSATPADIRKAYRKLAKQFHPDINKSDPKAQERFQEINEANEVLSDPEKRKRYDEYGEHWIHAEEYEAQRQQYKEQYGRRMHEHDFTESEKQGFGGFNFSGFGDFSRSRGNTSEFSDFFEQLFGSTYNQRAQQPLRGQDHEAELHITLRDITVSHKQILNIGDRNIRVTIPAGVADGQRLKLRGYGGEAPKGGVRGDLYITFRIEQDNTFRREGNNLYTTTTIPISTAVLGGETTIVTLTGEVRIKINAATQPGTQMRLKGKGLPLFKKENQYGDLIVTINPSVPSTLNAKQRELFEKLRETGC